MTTRKLEYEVQKRIDLPGGGSITVTVASSGPIDEKDYMILRPDAATGMAECIVSLVNSLRPPDSPEIQLNPAPVDSSI